MLTLEGFAPSGESTRGGRPDDPPFGAPMLSAMDAEAWETMMADRSWSLAQLQSELERYEAELRAAGKEQRTIDTYVGQSQRFVRFLTGDYRPDARPDRQTAGDPRGRR